MYLKIFQHCPNQGSWMSLFLQIFCSYTVCSMGKSTEWLANGGINLFLKEERTWWIGVPHREPLSIPHLFALPCAKKFIFVIGTCFFRKAFIYKPDLTNSIATVQPQALFQFINKLSPQPGLFLPCWQPSCSWQQ